MEIKDLTLLLGVNLESSVSPDNKTPSIKTSYSYKVSNIHLIRGGCNRVVNFVLKENKTNDRLPFKYKNK